MSQLRLTHILGLLVLMLTNLPCRANNQIEIFIFRQVHSDAEGAVSFQPANQNLSLLVHTSFKAQLAKPHHAHEVTQDDLTFSKAIQKAKRSQKTLYHAVWTYNNSAISHQNFVLYSNISTEQLNIIVKDKDALENISWGTQDEVVAGLVHLPQMHNHSSSVEVEIMYQIPWSTLNNYFPNQYYDKGQTQVFSSVIKEKRKIKPGELHYFDNQTFGVLLAMKAYSETPK